MRKLKTPQWERPDPGVVREAAAVLRSGGVIVYPTETLYGLGADARNPEAVHRVFEIKQRPPDRAVTVILGGEDMLGQVVSAVPELARKLAEVFWPGPLTLVLPARRDLPDLLLAGGSTIGVRVPGDYLCRALSRELGGPITATSANISGGPDLINPEEIERVLGDRVDLLIDAGPARSRVPSTVALVTDTGVRILREGRITAEELRKVVPELEG
ncbi:MAG: threonylcarbamoyl-AMP synthase [Calditrichaeota bacterium]|nr:threonylcarbamoyl-AMP synthase [Calditrichota bacterium]